MKRFAFSFCVLLCCFGLMQAQTENPPTPGKGMILRGILQDASGAPVSGLNLELTNWSGELVGTAMTESDGSFAFANVAFGMYYLTGSFHGQPFRKAVMFSNPVALAEVHVGGTRPPTAAANPAGDTVSVNALAAPPQARKKLDEARKALRAHQIARALELSGAAIARAPRWAEPYFFRGIVHLTQHEYHQAVTDLNRSLENNPQDPMALAALGSAMQQLGQYHLALAYLNYADRVKPIWQSYFTRAQVELKLHHPEQAIADAGHALSLEPPGPAQCHILRANGDLELHHYDDAVRELKLFLTLAPNSPEAGQARTVLGQLRAAMAEPPGARP